MGDGARVSFCFDHWTFLGHLINIFGPTGVTTPDRPGYQHRPADWLTNKQEHDRLTDQHQGLKMK